MKIKCWLKVPSHITELRGIALKQKRVRLDKQLLLRLTNSPERMSKFDKEIYEARLNAAADTKLKKDYVSGEIKLNKYLRKENKD